VVNASNEVTAPTSSQIIIHLDKAQIQTLMQTGKIMIQIVFNTTNAPTYIKIKDWHKIDLNVSAKVEYEFNID